MTAPSPDPVRPNVTRACAAAGLLHGDGPEPVAPVSALRRWSIFIYGIACYALFLGTTLYAYGFVAGIGTPTSLDRMPGPDDLAWPAALAVNLGLLALFAVQHSVMARPWFKARWTALIPEAAERSTYVLLTCVALAVLFAFWRPMGGVVWHVEQPTVRVAILALMTSGWLLVLGTTFLIHHGDLFGLRQVWLFLRGRPYVHLPFRTPGLYRVVRHPLYVGWLVGFWAAPTMTLAHFVFAAVTTVYILAAIAWEERDLIELHGQRYVDYRRRVPMLVPRLGEAELPAAMRGSRGGA
jgi:protein-S-isoprenylcysteine O-methyltransferase Ste14